MNEVIMLDQYRKESCDEELLRAILAEERVHTVFQPIVDLKRQAILGYEALIRGPVDSIYARPIPLFEAAAALGLDSELEVMCRKHSIRRYAELGLAAKLFLNISPGALTNPAFKKGRTLQYLQEYGISPERVVIEVTEQQRTKGYRVLAEALAHYRGMGFTVALDDLGAGYSGLRLWTEVLPDYIKIDKHFIRGIHNDRIKASFVASLCRMSAAANCRIIAEGVEQRDELGTVQKLGVALVQGYYFARPEPNPPVAIDSVRFMQQDSDDRFRPGQVVVNSDLSRIARRVEPLGAHATVNQVVEYLQRKPDLQLLPILDGETASGIINRHHFFNRLMASRFGVELYGKHPISRLLENAPILVDIRAELESVSQQLTSTPVPEQAFIITSEGRYHGVATVLDLLEIITEQKINNARHANPLTLLPGIVPVNKVINRMLAERKAFTVAYFDLDSFKPYNDYYGYAAGDRVIQLLADLLRRVYGESDSLIGHIGGDDFIVVDPADDYLENIARLLKTFAEEVPHHYERNHLLEGGINGIDRKGRMSFFSLVSVSVGVVPPDAVQSCQSHIDIADLASEAKKLAKKVNGNSFFVNRRSIVRV